MDETQRYNLSEFRPMISKRHTLAIMRFFFRERSIPKQLSNAKAEQKERRWPRFGTHGRADLWRTNTGTDRGHNARAKDKISFDEVLKKSLELIS